jgi:CPA2 family monovalent cation:H+ antiporter-2
MPALVLAGLSIRGAAFVGLGVAMSSSVVIVNITRSRRRTTDPPTEAALIAWSVLQDVTGVAISVVLLAAAGASDRPLGLALVGGVAFTAIAIGVSILLPRILRPLEAEADLFLIVSVAVGLAVAGVGAAVAGIPVALAAFVGGLAIVEGPEAAEVRRRLLPFRDLLAVLFFVLLGSLIDPTTLGRGLPWLALLVGLVVVAKSGLAAALARVARMSVRAVQLGTGLGQVGEFSFVLASAGVARGLIPAELYAAILGTVVVTIVGSTVLVRVVGPDRPAGPAAA